MRVFVTGASGWIGSAVVPELIAAGHEVVGLARSEASAAALDAAGAAVRRGDLDDLDGLGTAAAEADGVVHLAYRHDLSFTGDFEGAAAADRRAIEALGGALAGTGRPLVIASGTAWVAPGRVATEADGHERGPDAGRGNGLAGRHANAELTLSYASTGVRSSVVRLPPTVHGAGDPGFVSMVVRIAREQGRSAYIGDGANRWPAVHRLDAARLFRLAVERAEPGSTLHAVGDEGVAIRDVAEVIARHLEVPLVSIDPEEAAAHFGFLGGLLAADGPASSALTRGRLGWQPSRPGLLADLDEGHYFEPSGTGQTSGRSTT